jgi:hypothetical protein
MWGFLAYVSGWDGEPDVALVERQQDEVDVIMWRVDQLRRLGLAPDVAIELAEEKVDYREVERLVQRGCSLELVARILA